MRNTPQATKTQKARCKTRYRTLVQKTKYNNARINRIMAITNISTYLLPISIYLHFTINGKKEQATALGHIQGK